MLGQGSIVILTVPNKHIESAKLTPVASTPKLNEIALSVVSINETPSIEDMDEAALAQAILTLTIEDAKQNSAIPPKQTISGGIEYLYDIIGEAQWFLLDDDEECSCGFVWCCWALGLNPEWVRKRIRSHLKHRTIILPERERLQLAIRAGRRRMRKKHLDI